MYTNLCHVKTVVHGNLVHSMTQACIKTWRLQFSIYCKGLFQDDLGRDNQALVVGVFLSCQQKVCLCIFEYLYRKVDARELVTHTSMCLFLGGGVHFRMCCVCTYAGVCCVFLGGWGRHFCMSVCMHTWLCMCMHVWMCMWSCRWCLCVYL